MDTDHVVKAFQVPAFRIAAMAGAEEIGRLYIYLLRNDSHDRPFAFSEDLFVDEVYRGQGVARQLTAEAMRVAESNGCYKYLGTSRFNRTEQHRRIESYGLRKWGYEFRHDFDTPE